MITEERLDRLAQYWQRRRVSRREQLLGFAQGVSKMSRPFGEIERLRAEAADGNSPNVSEWGRKAWDEYIKLPAEIVTVAKAREWWMQRYGGKGMPRPMRGKPDVQKFAKLVAILKEHPGQTAIELGHLGWRPETDGDLAEAEKAGLIVYAHGKWYAV
jgi:hypothetical protein